MDATFKPPSLPSIHIPELFSKGDSPLETIGSNNFLKEQVNSLKNVIQKCQVDKQTEESKVVNLSQLITSRDSCIEELNRLVYSMQKGCEEMKSKLQEAEDGHIALSTSLEKNQNQFPSKYHLFTAWHTI